MPGEVTMMTNEYEWERKNEREGGKEERKIDYRKKSLLKNDPYASTE